MNTSQISLSGADWSPQVFTCEGNLQTGSWLHSAPGESGAICGKASQPSLPAATWVGKRPQVQCSASKQQNKEDTNGPIPHSSHFLLLDCLFFLVYLTDIFGPLDS